MKEQFDQKAPLVLNFAEAGRARLRINYDSGDFIIEVRTYDNKPQLMITGIPPEDAAELIEDLGLGMVRHLKQLRMAEDNQLAETGRFFGE